MGGEELWEGLWEGEGLGRRYGRGGAMGGTMGGAMGGGGTREEVWEGRAMQKRRMLTKPSNHLHT